MTANCMDRMERSAYTSPMRSTGGHASAGAGIHTESLRQRLPTVVFCFTLKAGAFGFFDLIQCGGTRVQEASQQHAGLQRHAGLKEQCVFNIGTTYWGIGMRKSES